MNGILVVNKYLGYTSRDVVNIVSKSLNTKKIGHTGTLDPMASGVLVLCVGSALKLCEMLTNHDKEYIAGITLGIETDTLDMEGTVLSTEIVDISKERIIEVVNSFKGSYMQEVPKYSAVKVNGKKLYEYARNNIDVKLPSKMVEIYSINIIDDIEYKEGKVFFKIKTKVSKGTYIRSLVRDIGNKLGVPAVMNSLVRNTLGQFNIKDSYTIDDIKNGNYKLISILESLPNMKRVIVDDDMAFKIRNGVMLEPFFEGDRAFIIDKNNNLIAIYENKDEKARVYKMFV
ncbi:MAG: tRNA pseudouridine(55) synthase TruB [Bacilli bacterium]|nr:tRNA pseudouridine(55) synthase TruB [Bacilli bacterium]